VWEITHPFGYSKEGVLGVAVTLAPALM